MGLGDVVSRVLTEFKADTSDMKQKLRELSGIEKERAQQQLASAEAANKNHDGFIKKLGQVGFALDTVGKFADFARDSLKSYGDHVRLESAAAGINIAKLSTAFGDLVSQHDLLTIAAQTQNGALRLNQSEMETLGQGAVAMKNRGFDLTEALKKLTDAAVKGKVEGLDDLGLSIKEGASKAETLKNLMDSLKGVIAETGSTSSTAADDVQRFSVAWDNTTESIKRFSAEAIMSLSEPLKMIQDIKDEIERGKARLNGTAVSQDQVFGAFQGAAAKRYQQKSREQLMAEARAENSVIKFDEGYTYDQNRKKSTWSARDLEEIALMEARKALAPYYAAAELRAAAEAQRATNQAQGYGDWRKPGGAKSDEFWMQGVGGFDFQAQLDKDAATSKARDHMADGYEEFRKRTSPDAMDYMGLRVGDKASFLESTFGKIEDFNLYGTAFGMLTGSVTSAMDAWITGSMSAGQAVKKFIGEALKGLASQMAIESLKHGAYAIGSLAFGDFRGAATHGAAAAAFGGAAAAAAIAAKEFGGGASPKASTGGAGAGAGGGGGDKGNGRGASSGGGSGSGGSERPIVVIVGSEFGDDTPRMKSIRANEAVEKAIRLRDE